MYNPREIVIKFAEIAKKCPKFAIPREFLDNLIAEDLETNILIGTLGTLSAINYYRREMDNPYIVAITAGIQVLNHNPMEHADSVMEPGDHGCVIVTTPIDGNIWYVVNHDNRTIYQINIEGDTRLTNSFMDAYFAKLHDAKYTNVVPRCSAMVYRDHERLNSIHNGVPVRQYDWNYDLIDIYENLYIISLWASTSPDILDELLQFASIPGVGRVLQSVHLLYEVELQPMIHIADPKLHIRFKQNAKDLYQSWGNIYKDTKYAIISATFAKITNIVDKIISEFERGNAVSRFSAGVLNIRNELHGQISPIELVTLLSKYVHICGDVSPEFACDIISNMRADPMLLSQICAEIRESPLEKYEQIQIMIQEIIDETNNPEPELFAIWNRYINQPTIDDDYGVALPKKSEQLPD